MELPVIELISKSRMAELEKLKLKAASGTNGCRAARERMANLRAEQLADCVRNRATGWRGRGH